MSRRHPERVDPEIFDRFCEGDPERRCRACGGRGERIPHHVIYRQHIRRAGGDEWDPRDALRVCEGCHSGHHHSLPSLPVACLRDDNFTFAFGLLGDAAIDYFARYYEGEDPRIGEASAEIVRMP